ncbi:ImmA/IrrE family metallo-endopeptidase [Microbacterium cremeum]|uniref:ImmA/IrrE family metallo-endopeptidase n=1 Tax=Microbacterium cremeum TaxID=2782169 RepID=UPI001887B6DB|nr:ImmA/IrrE family metallo-endopeptidase [Microbacterium cremeum]
MTPDAFSRAVNGSRGFSAAELAALSEVLNTSMYWLATGERDPAEALVVARHEFDHDTGDRHADWNDLRSTVERVSLAYRQAELSSKSINVPADADAVRAALGDAFVRTFAERLSEVYRIDVIRLGGLRNACSATITDRVVIILNETGNWFHQNWSLAHELGHVALGHANTPEPTTRGENDTQETSANAFAAELLLPRSVIQHIDWTSASGDLIAAKLWEWGVSSDALRRRLALLRCPTSPAVDQMLGWTTQKILRRFPSWNHDGTDQITARMDAAASRRFPLELQAAHVELISQGRLPKATLAWMLDVDEDEIEIDEPDTPDADIDELARALGFVTT